MDGAFNNMDRGYDGGRGRGPGAGRGFRGTAENAKTKLCTRWMSGDCRFGDRCNFAHGEQELRSLPPRDDFGRGRGGYGAPPPGRGGFGGRGMGGYGGGRGRGYDEYYGGGGAGGGGYGQGGYGGAPAAYGAPQDPYAGGYGGPPRGPGGEDPYARQGHPVHGPNGWVAYRTPDTGETYYHNHQTNVTQWERPADWMGPM